TSRDVVLTNDAIRHLWASTAPYNPDTNPTTLAPATRMALRLLLITAQRNSEVCGLRLSELDIEQRVWSLPIERTKKSQHHMLPLPDTAISIISEAMRTTADNTFLFASNSKEGHLTCGALDHAMVRIFQTWETDYT